MKSTLFLLGLFFLIVPITSNAEVCITLNNNLFLGARDSSVNSLQSFLRSTGDYTEQITGHFGLSTQQAVQRFQARAGIVSSGTPDTTGYGAVGPTTREAINAYCRSRTVTPVAVPTQPAVTQTSQATSASDVSLSSIQRTLTVGASGADVRALQTFLKDMGDYTFPEVTGFFGPVTQQAVQRFQARTGVVSAGTPATTGFGLVGPATRARITAEFRQDIPRPTPPPPTFPSTDSIPPAIAEPPHISPLPPTLHPTPTQTPQDDRSAMRPSVRASAQPNVIRRGESSTISWSSNNAIRCEAPFGDGAMGDGIIPIRTSGSHTLRPVFHSSWPIVCIGQGGDSAEVDVRITIEQTLSQTQIASIVSLLQSFGAPQGTIANVQSTLQGDPYTHPHVPSNLSPSQVSSIIALLQSFNTDTTTINLIKSILGAHQILSWKATETQVQSIINLLQRFGTHSAYIAEVEALLRNGTFSPSAPKHPSSGLAQSQITAITALLASFGAPPSIIEQFKTILTRGDGGGSDPIPEQPARVTLSVNRSSVVQGESVTFTWSAENASACSLPGQVDGGRAKEDFPIQGPSKGSVTLTPNYVGQSTYVVRCRSTFLPDEIATATVSVSVSAQKVSDQQKTIINAHNVYSPDLIVVGNTLRLYFGGWLSQGQRHDDIYVADCTSDGSSCSNIRTVINATEQGFNHLNDPSLIRRTDPATGRDYLIGYFTGVVAGEDGLVAGNNHIYYATSWADNGINWSKPQLLIKHHWLPSATVNAKGEVELYANDNTIHGGVVRINLGASGIGVGKVERVSGIAGHVANVHVEYDSREGQYHILAERMITQSVVDMFTSKDGVNWTLVREGVVRPASDQFRVGTPTFHPSNRNLIFFGSTAQNDSMGFKIRSAPAVILDTTFSRVRDAFFEAFGRGAQSLANTLTGFLQVR